MKKKDTTKAILVLNDIRSAENVGAIFRTADAAGVEKIYLTGITPTPTDRFGRLRKDMGKSALGAERLVPWEYAKQTIPLLKRLKKEKFYLVALEQHPYSVDYKKIKVPRRFILIVGNEVTGIPHNILACADKTIEIPQQGKKESLNVSVALGIALFRILNI